MIVMVMRVPNLRQLPAAPVQHGQNGCRLGRINAGRFAACCVMHEIAVIIAEAGKLCDFDCRHGVSPLLGHVFFHLSV